MDTPSSQETPNQASAVPAAEVLQPRADDGSPVAIPEATKTPLNSGDKKSKHRTYRPSHKATFIAIAAVVIILTINAVIIGFVLKNKSKDDNKNTGQVTISSDVLSKIGVNSKPGSDSSIELIVDPNAKFNGKVVVAGDLNLGGGLKLNSKLTANDASFGKIEAGDTSLAQLNVNGASTLSALNLRNTLVVAGATTLQGATTINQLLTVNNNLNVVGNVAIGGTLTTNAFSARNLVSSGTLVIGGHIITGGLTPGIAAGGGALGSNGTVSISGNDASGTISINIGVGATSGTLASVTFRTAYGSSPRVVITPVGIGANFYLSAISLNSFTVAVNGSLPPGGYALNYIVQQ